LAFSSIGAAWLVHGASNSEQAANAAINRLKHVFMAGFSEAAGDGIRYYPVRTGFRQGQSPGDIGNNKPLCGERSV